MSKNKKPPVTVYRLEHRLSLLGPFYHKSSRQKHPSQDVLKGLNTYVKNKEGEIFMPDITNNSVVANRIRRYPKAVFGWANLDKCLYMIKDPKMVHDFGFVIRVFNASPIWKSECEQVLFLRVKEESEIIFYKRD